MEKSDEAAKGKEERFIAYYSDKEDITITNP